MNNMNIYLIIAIIASCVTLFLNCVWICCYLLPLNKELDELEKEIKKTGENLKQLKKESDQLISII